MKLYAFQRFEALRIKKSLLVTPVIYPQIITGYGRAYIFAEVAKLMRKEGTVSVFTHKSLVQHYEKVAKEMKSPLKVNKRAKFIICNIVLAQQNFR